MFFGFAWKTFFLDNEATVLLIEKKIPSSCWTNQSIILTVALFDTELVSKVLLLLRYWRRNTIKKLGKSMKVQHGMTPTGIEEKILHNYCINSNGKYIEMSRASSASSCCDFIIIHAVAIYKILIKFWACQGWSL